MLLTKQADPRITADNSAVRFAPNLSMKRPTRNMQAPAKSVAVEKSEETAVRLLPRSSMKEFMKIEKVSDCPGVVKNIVSAPAPTATQP